MILRIKRGAPPYMLYCLLIAAWLCVAQVLGSTMLILPCLMAFLLLAAVAAWKGFATPILMFFLPWSPLLKMAPGTLSFYTFALGIVCVVCLVRKKYVVDVFCLLCTLPVVAISLFSKLLENYGISYNYILFVFMMVFFPVVAKEIHDQVKFTQLILFFSVGIISAALSAQQLLVFPQIARYIEVHTLRTVTRLCGYYGDPNFYSAQISATLAGMLLLILQEKNPRQRIGWSVLAVILLYCGLLSVSKSFILTMAVVLALWLYRFMGMRIAVRKKVLFLMSIFLAVAIIIVSGVVDEQIEMTITRFQSTDDVSSLTTGRSEMWVLYTQSVLENAKYFLMGRGLTPVLLAENSTHNTIIQGFYQLGVIGGFFFILWVCSFIRGLLGKKKVEAALVDMAIILTGTIMPWMGLDMLFFDELFLMPVYIVSGIMYFGKCSGGLERGGHDGIRS